VRPPTETPDGAPPKAPHGTPSEFGPTRDGNDISEPASPGMPEPTGQNERTKLFRYLTNELSGEYRQIMSLFAGPLLGDLSAAEVSAKLAATGLHLSPEEAQLRCEQLEQGGNLVRGVRDARVPTVKDYLRSRTRYQASKLGGRVHRDAEAVLAAGDGAREVARELLGATAAFRRGPRQLWSPSATTLSPVSTRATRPPIGSPEASATSICSPAMKMVMKSMS